MRLTLVFALMLLLAGCHNRSEKRSSIPAPHTESELIEINRSIIASDRNTIEEYVSESGEDFRDTGTGLWYRIVEEGSGPLAKDGDQVRYEYDCRLLNGTPCYSGTETTRLGYSDIAGGITEGLRLMPQSSSYVFIVPPYLAYGLTGDGNKIPGRAILLYNIRVISIN